MKILIVDDDPLILETLEAILRLEGHEVSQARNGQTALASLSMHTPDVALIDLYIPRMGGDSLVAEMRGNERWRDIPVLFMTAAAHPDLAAIPADIPLLRKPFEPAELRALLGQIAEGKRPDPKQQRTLEGGGPDCTEDA
jgi:CheY-like chemotaxis protein